MDERPQTTPPVSVGAGRRRWLFNGAVLDERTLELSVNGVDAELERKPLEVLLYLLQHAGEVCTKDELLAGVWPGRVLSETVLTKCIGRLRLALGDEEQALIKTVYGFGYRLLAPVKVETLTAPVAMSFDFRAGDHPPGRPLWSLVERLGVGGHGEAWRGRHDKTYEQRVFKFALDESALVALKREITLFRVINDTVGCEGRVVRLLDWNLEQSPCFIESEFIAGGSLPDWSKARGGIMAIPLEERLELMARLADVLAAVHSVGILHKDLKPSNILIRPLANNEYEVLLADFGSGAVLDAEQMDRLGITRLGFTRTVTMLNGASGTPLYLAPEVVAGQPFTVKSDLYSLGVVLYQWLVGDFTRVMSPGWERDLHDELLREDVALLAEGNPAMRLADAGEIARRLRSLVERREALRVKREALARAERARQLLERARARRVGLIAAFVTLVVGLATSTVLFLQAREARRVSELAAARAQAVTEFLSQDAFAPVSSGSEPVKDLPVTELLKRAGKQIDTRFARQPEIASELHYIIGRSLNEYYETAAASAHFNAALALGRQLHGDGSESALRSAAALIDLDFAIGKLRGTLPSYEETLAAGRATLDPLNHAVLMLRLQIGYGNLRLGNWALAESQLSGLLADLAAARLADADLLGHTRLHLGQALVALSRVEEARAQLRPAIDLLSKSMGAGHPDVTSARGALGRALTELGYHDEAQSQLVLAYELAEKWAPKPTWTVFRPQFYRALLLLEMDDPARARPLLAEIVDFQDAHAGERPELDKTATVRQALAETYARSGELATAIAILRTALRVSETTDGAQHPETRSIRLSLAEALLSAELTAVDRKFVEDAIGEPLAGLPDKHPFVAQRDRVVGLLAMRDGDASKARASLQAALDIHESRYGPRHWRSVRARQELQRATG